MDNKLLSRSLRALVLLVAAMWLYLAADNVYHLVLAARGLAWDASYGVFGRSVRAEVVILLALAAALPALWDMWVLTGRRGAGRGFDEGAARRLRRMGRCGGAVTALLALLVWVMLYDRADRVGEGMSVLQGLLCRLDFYVAAILGLTLAAAIGTAVLFLLSRLAERAALEQAVNDLTI